MRHRKFEFKLKSALLVFFLAGVSLFSVAQRKLTIEQALEIAEENNPSMKSAKLSLQRTQFNLEASRASLKPQFSLNVNPINYSQSRNFDQTRSEWYTSKNLSLSGTFQSEMTFLPTDATLRLTNTLGHQNSESTRSSASNKNKAFTNDLSLRLTQPIFTYNRTKMEMKRLEFDHENSGISYALSRLRTEQSITRQFYTVYLNKSSLEINLAELENVKKNYAIVKAKVDAEASPEEELAQAEVNLANANSSVLQSKVTLQNSIENLNQLLGLPLSEDIDVDVTVEAKAILIDEEKAIHYGLSSRMELRQREISMAEADLQMMTVKAQNEFRGDISLSLGISGDNENFANIYEKPTNSPRVSISFNVPIFDWGMKKARVNAQKTAQTIARLNYENEIVGIELDIRQSIRSLNNSLQQIEIAEIAIRNADNTYKLNQYRYLEGSLSGLQMSQFQTQFSNAQISLVRAQINYKNELLNMRIITLYDFEIDKPILPVKELMSP